MVHHADDCRYWDGYRAEDCDCVLGRIVAIEERLAKLEAALTERLELAGRRGGVERDTRSE